MDLDRNLGENMLGINVLNGLVRVGLGKDYARGRGVYVGVGEPYPYYR